MSFLLRPSSLRASVLLGFAVCHTAALALTGPSESHEQPLEERITTAETSPAPLAVEWTDPTSLPAITGPESGIGKIIPRIALNRRTLTLVNPAGAVGVYQLNESSSAWEREKVFFTSFADRISLAASEDLLVIGRPEDGRNNMYLPAGAVYVHERDRDGPEQWGETAVLEDWAERTMEFGRAVATDGETIAVRHSSGVVLFRKQRTSDGRLRWMEDGRIFTGDDTSDNSIHVSGDHLAVLSSTSNLRLYHRVESGGHATWTLTRILPVCLAAALHGDRLAFSWRGGSSAATVQTTDFDPIAGSWGTPQTVAYPGSSQPFSFGTSLALFGETLAVGAPDADGGHGRVYLFRKEGEGASFAFKTRLESERTEAEHLGQRLALADRLLVALGPEAQIDGKESGMAHAWQLPASAPVVIRHPQAQRILAGEDLRIEVRAEGTGPLLFRWHKNGELVAEAVEPVFSHPSAPTSATGAYSVEVTSPHGSTWSTSATISIDLLPPEFPHPTPDRFIAAGQPLELAPAFLASPPFSCQWRKDGDIIPGAEEAVFSLNDPSVDDTGTYELQVSNAAGTVSSGPIEVLVKAAPPVILRQSGAQEVKEGEPILMFAEVFGSGPLSFQWFHNGSPIPEATESRLLLANPRANRDGGDYTLTVTSPRGSVTTTAAPLTIRQPPPLPITAGNRAQVSGSGIAYDLYLPPDYTPDGDPLPILLTFSPGGGGMVSHFQNVAASLQIIVVGVNKTKNGTGWRDYSDYLHLLGQDLRERVNFDATRLFLAGFSGGGWAAFDYARSRHPHVAGVFSMEGWMGDQHSALERYQENLLVARSFAAIADHYSRYLDANFLLPTSPVIRDWVHAGGHVAAPPDVQRKALSWFLAEREQTPVDTRETALLQAAEWRANMSADRIDVVAAECLTALMDQPRTWLAHHAKIVLEEALASTHPLNRVRADPRPGSDLAGDFLFYYAYSAELAGQPDRAQNALHLFSGLTGTSGDREPDVTEVQQELPAGDEFRTYDDWAAEHMAALPAQTQAPESDANGDGVANFAAFGLGLDPMATDATRVRPVIDLLSLDVDQKGANLLYRQASRNSGVHQQLEVSTDMETWFPIDTQPHLIRAESTESHFLRAAVPLPDGERFLFRQTFEATP